MLNVFEFEFKKLNNCNLLILTINKKRLENFKILLNNKNFPSHNQLNQNFKKKLTNIILTNTKCSSQIKCVILKPTTILEAIFKNNGNIKFIFDYSQKNNLNETLKNKNILIAKIKNFWNLQNFCTNLIQTYGFIFENSELHKFNKKNYILTCYYDTSNDLNLTSLLTEFEATIEKGRFQHSIVFEHCQTIFLTNAIEKIIST